MLPCEHWFFQARIAPGEISARSVIHVTLDCLFVCLLVECRAGDVVLQTAG